jgi:tripartite ATP-independent transporter DctM subunit
MKMAVGAVMQNTVDSEFKNGIEDSLNKIVHALDKVGVFSRCTNVIGVAVLFLMVAVTFVDVILRYLFNRPIMGVVEITEVMMIVAVFLSVAYTQYQKGHVSVDLVISRLSAKARLVMNSINSLIALGLFGIVTWRLIVQTLYFAEVHSQHTEYFTLPDAPFAAITVLGLITLSILVLQDLLRNINDSLKNPLNWYHWLLIFAIPVFIIILAGFWMQPDLWQMSLPLVGLIGIVVSLLFFLMGMPVSFALILTAFIFIGHIRGPIAALDILGTDIYRTTGSYSWSVLPFFVIMGYFCLYAKFGEDLYYAAYKWFGHLRGGMAIATIGACTAFAAIVGDSVAATATMGSVALPQMRKYGYNDHLSSGCIVGGASLGPIIPPSVTFIVYGLLTQMSIGTLFMAGIIPGLIIAFFFCILIIGWCRVFPKAGPAGQRSEWIPRFVSLKAGGPVVILFLLVVGGIYIGIFTPTEGGAIGAVGALIIGLFMRRFTWKIFTQSLIQAGSTVAMVFLILIGGLIFTRFAAWCNISNTVTQFITTLGLSPQIYVLFAMVIMILLGFFVDIMPLLLIGIPILHPIAVAMGINPCWFAILICISINLGALTPPVGINLFILKGLNKEIPISTIYKGALPFCFATIVSLIILFTLPSTVTWLPGLLK